MTTRNKALFIALVETTKTIYADKYAALWAAKTKGLHRGCQSIILDRNVRDAVLEAFSQHVFAFDDLNHNAAITRCMELVMMFSCPTECADLDILDWAEDFSEDLEKFYADASS